MNDSEKTRLLNEHIPYRLMAIDGLCWACDVIMYPDYPVQIKLRDGVIQSETYRVLTNPFFEIGCIFCRVMLEFLGITLSKDRKKLMEKSRKSNTTDIWIEDFRIPAVKVADLCDSPLGRPQIIEEACVEAILVANKAIAHLTQAFSPPADPQHIKLGAETVLAGVENHLYKKLSLKIPKYRAWTTSKQAQG